MRSCSGDRLHVCLVHHICLPAELILLLFGELADWLRRSSSAECAARALALYRACNEAVQLRQRPFYIVACRQRCAPQSLPLNCSKADNISGQYKRTGQGASTGRE